MFTSDVNEYAYMVVLYAASERARVVEIGEARWGGRSTCSSSAYPAPWPTVQAISN